MAEVENMSLLDKRMKDIRIYVLSLCLGIITLP